MRVLLVRHGLTEATRRARFGADGPLTASGRAAAAALRLPRTDATTAVSPARCAAETADALGLRAAVEPALADWDPGAWRGRTLDDVPPEELTAWRAGEAPHGGERLADVLARAAAWLERLRGGALVAITHAAVVRACVVGVLGAPASAFWALDVAPLGVTELRRRDGRWTVRRVNAT